MVPNTPQELFGVRGPSVDKAWQVTTGRELRTAQFPGSTTATLAISPTALVVAAVNWRDGRYVVELWGEEGGR